MSTLYLRRTAAAVLLLTLLLTPLVMLYAGKPFWLDIFTRLVILAIAASSLSLLLSVAGLASFGHAAYIGLGAYAVGIPVYYETHGGSDWLGSYNGWWHLLLAILVCGLFAFVTGAISLRTRGVHFIMITMAFSQMIFYLFVSLEEFGGDDGLSVDQRSEFALLNIEEPWVFYLLCYGLLLLVLFIVFKLTHSHFGRVLQAARQNETRVLALGVNPYWYRLIAFVIAGIIGGLAGVLFANFSYFVSPGMVDWTRSGELMFMVILGGVSSLFGPLVGAISFVLVEYVLSRWTIFWHLPFGLLLLAVVLFGRGGVIGLLKREHKS